MAFPAPYGKKYSNLYNCDHDKIVRIDDKFVRCLNCKKAIVNHKVMETNRSRFYYERENENVLKNFRKYHQANMVDDLSKDLEKIRQKPKSSKRYYTNKEGNTLMEIIQISPNTFILYDQYSKHIVKTEQVNKIIKNLLQIKEADYIELKKLK